MSNATLDRGVTILNRTDPVWQGLYACPHCGNTQIVSSSVTTAARFAPGCCGYSMELAVLVVPPAKGDA